MITVNDQNYAAYGGIEGKRRYDAEHNTYDYIEDRLQRLIKELSDIVEDKQAREQINSILGEIDKIFNIINNLPDSAKDEYARERLLELQQQLVKVKNKADEYSNKLTKLEFKVDSIIKKRCDCEDTIKQLRQENARLSNTINLKARIDYEKQRVVNRQNFYNRVLEYPYYNEPQPINPVFRLMGYRG